MPPSAANYNRPPEFDAAVAAYVPGLTKRAARYCSQPADQEDLVNDTVERALRTWQGFQDGGALWWWLRRCMAQVVASRQRRAVGEPPAAASEQRANQEDRAHLMSVLGGMPDNRTREIMLAIGAGETGPEIAARHGIGDERVRQIVRAERARLREMAA